MLSDPVNGSAQHRHPDRAQVLISGCPPPGESFAPFQRSAEIAAESSRPRVGQSSTAPPSRLSLPRVPVRWRTVASSDRRVQTSCSRPRPSADVRLLHRRAVRCPASQSQNRRQWPPQQCDQYLSRRPAGVEVPGANSPERHRVCRSALPYQHCCSVGGWLSRSLPLQATDQVKARTAATGPGFWHARRSVSSLHPRPQRSASISHPPQSFNTRRHSSVSPPFIIIPAARPACLCLVPQSQRPRCPLFHTASKSDPTGRPGGLFGRPASAARPDLVPAVRSPPPISARRRYAELMKRARRHEVGGGLASPCSPVMFLLFVRHPPRYPSPI